MKINKKGFTLIELLAVIVILAIIMVIAIPQILNVINDSRDASWKNSADMIAHSLELNSTLFDPQTGAKKFDIATNCSGASTTLKTNLQRIVDLGDISTVSCDASDSSNGIYKFILDGGSGSFAGKYAEVTCTINGIGATCKTTSTATGN